MARTIVKVGHDQYVEWSSVVDAPVTNAMTREDFAQYHREEYGRRFHNQEFTARMKRVEKHGTSSYHGTTPEELTVVNNAGPNGSTLTWPEIVALVTAP